MAVNASDVRILMGIEREQVLAEGGSGVVFLAREVTDQLVKWTAPVKPAMVNRRGYTNTSTARSLSSRSCRRS